MTLRAWVFQYLVSLPVAAVVESRRKIQAEDTIDSHIHERPIADSGAGGKPIYWFHAASVGEFEALLPVLWGWIALRPEATYLISGFSPSLRKTLSKTAARLSARGIDFRIGISPVGPGWDRMMGELPRPPEFFLTVKYEAWPELWVALARRNIPLILLNARARGSLKISRALLAALGLPLPRMLLLTDEPGIPAELTTIFPEARISWGGDPRWDRVREVLSAPSPRAQELLAAFREERPQIALAQVWPQDRDCIRAAIPHGKLWVIPHVVTPESTQEWMQWFAREKISVRQTSAWRPGEAKTQASVVLVDEIGVLIHLYAGMRAVYVGGGFGHGPHSTIEPAFAGIPISCGPHRASRFSEIGFLQKIGQLRVLKNPAEFNGWLQHLLIAAQPSDYREKIREQWGATERILREIDIAFPSGRR